MRSPKWIVAGLVVVFVGLRPAVAAAADAKPTPTLVVRVKSIDGLLADAKYLAGLAGQEEQAKQFEKMIPSFLGPKGLAGTGLDTSRPLGLYGILDPQMPDRPPVVLLPVSDEKAFVDFLKQIAGFAPGANVSIEKGDDGVYTVSSAAPVQAYFTIAEGYAYVTATKKDPIAKANRLPATDIFPVDDKTLLGVTLRIDAIEPTFKQIALGAFENQAAALKEKKGRNEPAEVVKFRDDLVDFVTGQLRSLLSDGRAVEFRLALDRQTGDINAEAALTAKPGSPLAEQIAGAASRPSRFGPLANAAGQAALNVGVPEVLRSDIGAAVEAGFKQGLAGQKDQAKKDLAQKVFDVIMPTVKAGELDVFLAMVGPNPAGKYTVAGGIKLKDAGRVDQLIRDLVKIAPDPKAKEAIRFDAESVGDVKVHKIVPPERDAEMKRVFGDDAIGLFAFPPDAEVAAFGADAAEVLRQILATTAKPGSPFRAEGSVGRLAQLDQHDGPRAQKAAAAAFGGDAKADVIQLAVEGGPSLRVRAWMKTSLVKFAAKMDEAKKQENR
jgi:hypothetical protein